MNVSQVCSWISHCETHHGDRCNIAEYQPAALITDLKLIDVIGKRIIDAPSNTRYFALSYMWGGVTQLHLTSENESELMSYAILERFQGQIPQTIQDAMKFVADCAERYLWVDSLHFSG